MKQLAIVALVIGLGGCGSTGNEPVSQLTFDEVLNRPLVADALGCVIRDRDGQKINDEVKRDIEEGNEVVLRPGTYITGGCFPMPE